jgi:hypothetical protein
MNPNPIGGKDSRNRSAFASVDRLLEGRADSANIIDE